MVFGLNGHNERISASNDLVNHADKIVSSGCDSDVSQAGFGPVAKMEEASELQMGHDSQHEDGELKESIECTWEDLVVRIVKVNRRIMDQMIETWRALAFLNALSCWLKSREQNARDGEFLSLRVWVPCGE